MKKKAAQFPKNYRKIPEYVKGNPRMLGLIVLSVICSCILALSISIVSVDLDKNYQSHKGLVLENKILTEQEQGLKTQIEKFPNRDAYYNLAIVEYELGKMGEADKNINMVISFDPNFQKGILLKRKIEGD